MQFPLERHLLCILHVSRMAQRPFVHRLQFEALLPLLIHLCARLLAEWMVTMYIRNRSRMVILGSLL